MARTLSEIYNEAVAVKNRNFNMPLSNSDKEYNSQQPFTELENTNNSSRMSVMDAFIWIVSACIWSLENLFDVFQSDLILDLRNRINGTTSYYINALYKYQHGDTLKINETGTQFYYENDDPAKRIISKVACEELREAKYFDRMVVFKAAKNNVSGGGFTHLSAEELAGARAYLNQISFAGTHCHLSSRLGDIVIPVVTAYCDGTMTDTEIRNGIRKSLTDYINNLSFNATIYVNDILNAIKEAPGVVNVDYDHDDLEQGVFVVQFDDDGEPIKPNDYKGDDGYQDLTGKHLAQPNILAQCKQRIGRVFVTSSGFLREAENTGEEKALGNWGNSITVINETSISGDMSANGYCYGKA